MHMAAFGKKRIKRTVTRGKRNKGATRRSSVARRPKHEPKGMGTARKRLTSDINATDIGERGPTGPAAY